MGKRFSVLALLLPACAVLAAPNYAGRNLLGYSTFSLGPPDWITAGQNTTAMVEAQVARSTGHALRVTDVGSQMGQSTTPHLPARAGEVFHAEAWVKLDPALRDRGIVDIEFFAGTRFLGVVQVAEVTSTD